MGFLELRRGGVETCWLIHYNFFRPHEYLDGKTPAEKAGIKFTFDNWLDVVRQRSYPTHKDIGTGAGLVD